MMTHGLACAATAALIAVLVSQTGCSPLLIVGTEDSIHAAGDVLTGVALVGKQPGNIQGAHYELRARQAARPSLWSVFTRTEEGGR